MTANQAIWLYGSFARGDPSDDSDVDILVVGSHGPPDAVRNILPSYCKAVSQYSWKEIERMADYGSVFLQHLRTEAFPLFSHPTADQRLAEILQNLGPYRRAIADFSAFRATLADVNNALEGDCAPEYELAVLGSIARHASVLACFLAGGPVYGREEAFSRLQSILDLPTDPKADLLQIYEYRLAEERGSRLKRRATVQDVRRYLAVVESVLNGMEKLVCDYSRAVHQRA